MKKSKSVLKRIRQNETRRGRNRASVSKYKTAVKKLESAMEQKDAAAARNVLPAVVRTLDKAVSKTVLSKKSASRKKSSLVRRINALG
ncbi:MAG: 30S ribosomal protein S20 [Candidatus Lindowbacteria bacterium]|nr:30S ribosomal protein S20 [Candidatus Lindowbacteria bacterium]